MRFSISGCSPSVQALSNTGAITKKVRNRASEISTRLAGVDGSPMPERRNEKAMMKRVKLVAMINRPGATESIVIRNMYWTMRPVTVASPGGSSVPMSGNWASAGPASER